jgi:N-acetylglucosaminyl-diphospho-decaprenol L-rhamnosyltransferase
MTSKLRTGDKRLTVLIISWNAWHHLQPCLQSVLSADFSDLSILVVDNASSDHSADLVRSHYPQVRLIENLENLGHTRAVNIGLDLVDSELVLILDADTEIESDAIRHLVNHLDAHPEIGMVVPRTFNTDGSIQETARNFPTAMSAIFGRQGSLSRLFPQNPFTRRYLMRDTLDRRQPFRVESVASSCMLLRSSLIDLYGKWDEGYPGYFVDTDWCYRLKQSAVPIYCIPDARITHHEQNHRGKKRSPSRIWMFHMGAFRYYRRHKTIGWLDPRSLFAGVALSVRAMLMIMMNQLKCAPGVTGESQNRPAQRAPGAHV